jgi:hypothetical protein
MGMATSKATRGNLAVHYRPEFLSMETWHHTPESPPIRPQPFHPTLPKKPSKGTWHGSSELIMFRCARLARCEGQDPRLRSILASSLQSMALPDT